MKGCGGHDTTEWDDKISLYELKVAMSLSNLTAVGVLIWKIRSQSSKFATKKVDEIGKEGFILGMRLCIWVVLPVKRVPRECPVHNSYTQKVAHTHFKRNLWIEPRAWMLFWLLLCSLFARNYIGESVLSFCALCHNFCRRK